MDDDGIIFNDGGTVVVNTATTAYDDDDYDSLLDVFHTLLHQSDALLLPRRSHEHDGNYGVGKKMLSHRQNHHQHQHCLLCDSSSAMMGQPHHRGEKKAAVSGNTIVDYTKADTAKPRPTAAAAAGGESSINNNDTDDDDENSSDSSSDDDNGMLMFGGGLCSDSSDDDDYDNDKAKQRRTKNNSNDDDYNITNSDDDTTTTDDDDDDNDEEDEISYLKRALSIHDALLLLSPFPPSRQRSKDATYYDTMMAQRLVIAIISHGHDDDDVTATTTETTKFGVLANALSRFIFQEKEVKEGGKRKTNNNKSNNNVKKQQQQKRINLSRALLVVQFLLKLNDIDIGSSSSSIDDAGIDNDDRMTVIDDALITIILPLIFGSTTTSRSSSSSNCSSSNSSMSIFLTNIVLQDTIMNHVYPTTTLAGIVKSCKLCLDTLQCAVAINNTKTTTTTTTTTTTRRKFILDTVCHVLVRIHDHLINNQSKNKKKKKMDDDDDAAAATLTFIRDTMHSAIITILRSVIVVVTGHTTNANKVNDDDEEIIDSNNTSSTILSLSAMRYITGILLPKLYPPMKESNVLPSLNNDMKNINMLWNEISKLLMEYNDIIHHRLKHVKEGVRGEEENSNYDMVPMAATAMLCIVLPTFRSIELQQSMIDLSISADNNNMQLCSRPLYQSRLWTLLRHCMGRCGGVRGSSSVYDGTAINAAGGGGRGMSLLSSHDNCDNADEEGDYYRDRASLDQLLRRRSAYALRIMLEHERGILLRSNNDGRSGDTLLKKSKKKMVGNNIDDIIRQRHLEDVNLWMKYVLCFEMLEMETELHLVEQVWTTICEITSQVNEDRRDNNGDEDDDDDDDDNDTDNLNGPPILRRLPRPTWDDVGSLLRLVLASELPTMRKLGLFRFLSGHTGVETNPGTVVTTSSSLIGIGVSSDKQDEDRSTTTTFINPPNDKGSTKKTIGGSNIAPPKKSLCIVSVDFVINVVLRSYDSIIGTKAGEGMQIEEEGRQERVSISDLLTSFLVNYTISLVNMSAMDGVGDTSTSRLSEFVNLIFGPSMIQGSKARSLILYYRSVASALDTLPSLTKRGTWLLNLDPDNIIAAIRSMRAMFSSGGAPKAMQDSLRLDLATVLKSAKPWNMIGPSTILQVLAMFPPLEVDEAGDTLLSKARLALSEWLTGFDDGKWAKNASSACASAFVSGQLLPFGDMNVMSGIDFAEREIGMSVCVFCLLSGGGSELLWPAVSKGLQSVITTTALSETTAFCKANRSMVLLEYGCKEGMLSGMGNGDVLLGKSNGFMVPPPPNIESLLGSAVQFIIGRLESLSTTLFKTNATVGTSSSFGATRSSTSNSASAYLAILIGQLRVLYLAYPSSIVMSQAVDVLLQNSVKSLTAMEHTKTEIDDSTSPVKSLILCYAALSCGASFVGEEKLCQLILTCRTILNVELSLPPGIKNDAKQAYRSIFQYAKWGCLSLTISLMKDTEEVEDVYQAILESARASVDATPAIALPSLFDCALHAGNYILTNDGHKQPLLCSLELISDTLFAVLNEEISSSTYSYMLHEVCKLLFREKLLLDEYTISFCDDNGGPMPIMQAFERLLKLAGVNRPYIRKTVVSQISVAWLGTDSQLLSSKGLCAIPYREHIVDLLVFKECRFDDANTHSGDGVQWTSLPEGTDGSSITRAFVLSFLSKLPSPGEISEVVLKQLVHFVLNKLLDICCTSPIKGKAFISGSESYARMIRGWQALCLLSRFVTAGIAEHVASRVFYAMGLTLHGQIRYFVEVFTIQCTRRHSTIFGQMFLQEVKRKDLTLPQVSSLMIIGGTVIVGPHSSDFFNSSTESRVKDVLCGVLPWLSSTQGFSRAIAQLLCHKLIPLVVDVAAVIKNSEKDEDVLRSIYSFLESNTEMARLRKKQQNFFDNYDADTVCSLSGILSMPVDEGEEAKPNYMVDIIRVCLDDIYKDAHDDEAPAWKQMEDLLLRADLVSLDVESCETAELVNFQRKILPIDSLDLGIRSFHELKSFNAAGKKKQDLIVCAALIDKVPNLAGLARTCEIFAARCLVIHNLLVKKQDDFKSISVSANDWIDMEECKEQDLLAWLHNKKSEGYSIIGLEQTASSKCLTQMKFPDKTVLLLGKEKEGIPIQFLSAVDQCIEIPQLGIIRSLNVHVSGAICLWEYTKQKMNPN